MVGSLEGRLHREDERLVDVLYPLREYGFPVIWLVWFAIVYNTTRCFLVLIAGVRTFYGRLSILEVVSDSHGYDVRFSHDNESKVLKANVHVFSVFHFYQASKGGDQAWCGEYYRR